MKYKILYIEDQLANSIKDDLSRNGFDVEVNDANNFETVLDEMSKNYDAYLMDFRLTANKGRVDAPAFASAMRTDGKNQRKKPIILITDERYLSVFENDFTSQDLFDFVKSKKLFRDNIEKYCIRIKALIEAYHIIERNKYDIATIVDISNDDILDYRLINKLDVLKSRCDTYGFCRTINFSLIRSSGLLIGDEILAARLGVDKSSSEFGTLLSKLNECKYTGILSTSYSRWWFHKILDFWGKISRGTSLRRLGASERVKILNEAFGLNLNPAKPIKYASSTNFWTICTATLSPLDPNEGYVIHRKELEDWQEQEYISLFGAIEYPNNQAKLSPIDRSEILEYTKNVIL